MDSLVCARQTGKVKTSLVSLMALAMLTARGGDLAGHYVLKDVMEVGSELLLESDGGFEYTLAYGAADYWAKGTWRRKDNSVVLNSAGRKEAPFDFLRSKAGRPGKICVWVLGKNGLGVENIQVALQTVDQHFEATTTSDGAAAFPGVAHARQSPSRYQSIRLRSARLKLNPPTMTFISKSMAMRSHKSSSKTKSLQLMEKIS